MIKGADTFEDGYLRVQGGGWWLNVCDILVSCARTAEWIGPVLECIANDGPIYVCLVVTKTV